MKRILTGDRPSGRLHIGHLFGALQDRVALQDDYETFVLIADVQALTDHFNTPDLVRRSTFEVALDNLAVGIDPHRSTLFIQSLIPQIAELTVFYSNLVTISRLHQNPTVKSEIAQKRELFGTSVTYGFLGYPVSQAADITAFGADLVPVGEDQLPQLEQTRDIVRRFNAIYGETLKEPAAKLGRFPRVRGLDGSNKMSKSLGNAIYLADDAATIEKKVLGAVTDPAKVRLKDPGNPEVCTVYEYHGMFSPDATETVASECRSGTRGCVFCKRHLATNVNALLSPIRERREGLGAQPQTVREILMDGTERARKVAGETLAAVKESVGIDYFAREAVV